MPDARAFVLGTTRIQQPPHTPEIRLHLADEVMPLWEQTKWLPFWAFAWLGCQAVARYLLDHPQEVRGRRVLDLAAGCGLCAIAAMLAGAVQALAADTDPFAAAAVRANAGLNGVHVDFTARNLLLGPPPDVHVIVAGDVCYEPAMAASVLEWLRTAHAQGVRVLVGDPGRTYFPRRELLRLAEYDIAASPELEDAPLKRTGVHTFPG